MNAKRKKSVVGPVFFLFVIFVLVTSAVLYGGYRRYEKNKADLMKAVNDLPSFDPEAEAKGIAEEKKWAWPFTEAPVPKSKVDEIVKKAVSDAVAEKFPPKELSSGMMELMRKYSMAKAGDTITIKLKASNEVLTGEFRRREEAPNTGMVVVMTVSGVERKSPLRIIADEYAYMFTEAASEAEQGRRIDEFKKTFEKNRDEYEAKIRDEILPKKYESLGYVCDDDGNWISKKAFIQQVVDYRQKKFEKDIRQKLEALCDRHALLWVMPIEIDREKIIRGKLPVTQKEASAEK